MNDATVQTISAFFAAVVGALDAADLLNRPAFAAALVGNASNLEPEARALLSVLAQQVNGAMLTVHEGGL